VQRKKKKKEETRCKLRKKREVSNLWNVVSLVMGDILHTMSATAEASQFFCLEGECSGFL